MRFPGSSSRPINPLRLALVLAGLILLLAGCATMSRAKIGISGEDETKPVERR